jgi:hypothetical protein
MSAEILGGRLLTDVQEEGLEDVSFTRKLSGSKVLTNFRSALSPSFLVHPFFTDHDI